ncbi:MAG: glycosyltransferase family A protein [Pseudomonadota bacterium]
MQIDASFIVPTKNRAAILRHSLPMLLRQESQNYNFEIVVVSDGFESDTAAVLKEFNSPNLHYDNLKEASGAAAARNRAIELASGNILIFVDDDSLVLPNFLQEHLKSHQTSGDAVATGPIIDVSQLPSEAAFPNVRLFDRHLNAFPTGNASIPKSRVLDAGGFDETFTTYGWEDPELFHRISKVDIERKFLTSAPIYHYKSPGTSLTFPQQLKQEQSRGRNGALFYTKHPAFSVALQTKQLKLIQGLDRVVNSLFGLEEKVEKAIKENWSPTSSTIKSLMLLHAEIDAGRQGYKEFSQSC